MIPVAPSLIPEPFATNGTKNDIPAQSPGASEPNASWNLGFPPVTMLNRKAGGKPPLGADFNGILNVLSQHAFFTQSGCLFPWQGASEQFPGLNYLVGAHVLGSDMKEYIAVQPSGPDIPASGGGYVGPKNPVTDTAHAYWQPAVTAGDLPEFDGTTIKEINGKYGVPEFTAPTSSAPGKAGLVPGPGAGKADAYLRGDGTWSLDVSGLEAWRKSMIGAPMMLPSPVLPAGYMWADGTLASFEDWPELKAAYQAGNFQGYVLPANASDADKAAYPGKWVLAANSAGLYTPRLSGLFARYCSTEGAGAYNKPGLPNITSNWSNFNLLRPASSVSDYIGAFSAHAVAAVPVQGGSYGGWDGLSFNASRSSAIYGASATVTPESANLPAALYLGRFAEV